ncbi:MAG TPA: glutathione transferase GstA [Stellaceae bacterium]|nr:glutathione transferase GstA [Stellaceae bacterium]
MKLYFFPGACSLSPHIVLREAGVNFESEQVDLATKKTKSGADYMKINPKGKVPFFQLDNGQGLTEGPAIVQYIADQKPGAGLAPANGTLERYHLQEWLNYITSELHQTFSPLFRPNTPEEFKKITKETLAQKFAYLDNHFAKNQYLMGDRFTVADAYCFTIVNWVNFVSIDLAPYKNLSAYQKRVASRPKVQEALKAEGLVK